MTRRLQPILVRDEFHNKMILTNIFYTMKGQQMPRADAGLSLGYKIYVGMLAKTVLYDV